MLYFSVISVYKDLYQKFFKLSQSFVQLQLQFIYYLLITYFVT